MPLRRLGPVGKQWLQVRKAWVKLHPPNHQGYYICALCGRWVPEKVMELDHIVPRSRAPELRFVLENLQPTCHACNTTKGSSQY